MVEADLVDCMVALPPQLFYNTQIPACLWFLNRAKAAPNRRGQILFIDARNLGTMVDRSRRELTDEDIARIAGTYHAWRGQWATGSNEDVPGIASARHQGRYGLPLRIRRRPDRNGGIGRDQRPRLCPDAWALCWCGRY